GHTYGGNPLAAAVALANLELFRDEETLAGLPVKIEHIAMHLAQLAMHPHVGHVRQCGMIAAVELSLDPSNDVAYPWQEKRGMLACRAAMEQGVWLRPLGNVIVVMPPLAISLEQIDQIFLALRYGIDHAT
ncbi:MAG: aminotransferase class III-fold pyridoxal phosphate-dependent enzyme, partial [Planctomycetales bacterium]|nr:aminotransferase class III-fold pyridoxal phosphate-dependent enzyme [Planctomycetales bacterium]